MRNRAALDRTAPVPDETFPGIKALKDLLEVFTASPAELRGVSCRQTDRSVCLQETRTPEAFRRQG